MSRKCDGADGGFAPHPLYDALGTGHCRSPMIGLKLGERTETGSKPPK